jgi:hypothetical protein
MTAEGRLPKVLMPRESTIKAVSYWTEKVKVRIIDYDSVNKETFHKEWQREQDIPDYKSNIEKGVYDFGFAIRTGWFGIQFEDWYLIVLDFDTLEAFQIWCGDDYNLDTLAKWTRVEWHKNPEKIHVFFLSKTPFIDFAGGNDKKILEVYGHNPHLVCVFGTHRDGNIIEVYDNEEIAIIDGIKKLEIENRIKRVIPTYLDDDTVNSYVQELEKPETIVPAGSVHIAVRTMLMSVYFRWTDDFAPEMMSDEQRLQYVIEWDKQKAIISNRPSYIEANPKKLEGLWKNIQKKFQGQRQEQRDKREEQRKSGGQKLWINDEMPGCIAYPINPDRFIVGTPDSMIAEVTRKAITSKNGITYVVEQTKTFTACKPVKITKHVNRLSFLEIQDKYTIEFRGIESSGCFVIKHKSISDIVNRLKDGNALNDKGIDIAIQAQIKGFERAKLLEIDNTIDYIGFFPIWNDNKYEIISSKVDIPEKYPDVTDALKYIDELVERAYKGRENLLSHTYHWFMIAPFSIIFKVIGAPVLEWVHLDGYSNTSKSSSGDNGLAIDSHERLEEFRPNMEQVRSNAQFGSIISMTTFPKVFNEIDTTEKTGWPGLTRNVISAVDAIILRSPLDKNRNTIQVPAFTPLYMTGNETIPTDTQYVKRVRTRYFPESEIHYPNSKEAIDYKEWLATNIRRAHPLGLARNKLVMDSQECQKIILDTKLTPFEKSTKIWTAIYKSAGRELPEFFNTRLENAGDQMQNSIEDKKVSVMNALEAWIVDRCKTLDTTTYPDKKILDLYNKSTERLDELIKKNLVPYVKRGKDGTIIFLKQLTTELERFGAKQLDLPKLRDMIPNADYGKVYHGYFAVKCRMEDLAALFKEEPTTVTPPSTDTAAKHLSIFWKCFQKLENENHGEVSDDKLHDMLTEEGIISSDAAVLIKDILSKGEILRTLGQYGMYKRPPTTKQS